MPSPLEVVFLGTGGSAPSAARAPLATLVRSGETSVLVDCGEGCARQLLASGTPLERLSSCFITHLHADHYLGLAGLLSLLADAGRTPPLSVIGPHAIKRIVDPLAATVAPLPFAVEQQSLTRRGVVKVGDLTALAFPVDHVGPALGYAFADRSGVRVVVSGDTRPSLLLERIARLAPLLIHEATFCDDEQARACETRHSTAREAATLASRARVGALALVHVSSRHRPNQALREARSVFPETKLPRDLDRALVRESGVSWTRFRAEERTA